MLLKATYYSSLNQISQKLAVSKRSIYYDICKLNEWLEYYNVSGLNEWLEYYNVSGLKVVRGKGIFIDENNKKKNNQKSFKVYRELNLKYIHSKPKQESLQMEFKKANSVQYKNQLLNS
mgnify:CR=1 FL=1